MDTNIVVQGAGAEHALKIMQALEQRQEQEKPFVKRTNIFQIAKENETMSLQREETAEQLAKKNSKVKLNSKQKPPLSREEFKAKYTEVLAKTADMMKVVDEIKAEEKEKLQKATEGMDRMDQREYVRNNENPLADGEIAMTAILPIAMAKMMLLGAEYLGVDMEQLKMLNTKKD
jgi:adenine-specific DNA methylase